MTALSRDELRLWARTILEFTGITLDDSKGYLVETRLGPLLRETGCTTFTELHQRVRAGGAGPLRRKVVDAITTNETSFFRDTAPFELLRHKLLPELVDRRKNGAGRVPLRIWSAACSSGQEVYSMAMAARDVLGDLSRYDLRILGTDISDRVLSQASQGIYSRLELDRGMTDPEVSRSFTAAGERWKVRDELRSLATFKLLNLLEPFTFPGPFDIIFCRNVAIYFTEPDRRRLFQSLSRVLARDGALVIGATESLTGLCPDLEAKRYLRSVFYQLKPQG